MLVLTEVQLVEALRQLLGISLRNRGEDNYTDGAAASQKCVSKCEMKR